MPPDIQALIVSNVLRPSNNPQAKEWQEVGKLQLPETVTIRYAYVCAVFVWHCARNSQNDDQDICMKVGKEN